MFQRLEAIGANRERESSRASFPRERERERKKEVKVAVVLKDAMKRRSKVDNCKETYRRG